MGLRADGEGWGSAQWRKRHRTVVILPWETPSGANLAGDSLITTIYPYALHLFLSKVVCPAFIATALYWLQLQGKETYTCHLKYPDAGQTSWEDMLKHFCLFSSENVYLLQFWNFHGSWGKETEDNEMKEGLFSFNQAVTQTFRNYLVLPLSQEPRDHRWE